MEPHQDPALVLVVDDDMMLRYLAREALELEGFRVQEAADGAEALEHIAHERLHIILLDVQMPGMDGFTLCTTLRETPSGALLPVMMMTASSDVAAINRAYEVGATDFVTKPVNWTIITQRLRYTLRASQALERARLSEAKLASAQRVGGFGSLGPGPANRHRVLIRRGPSPIGPECPRHRHRSGSVLESRAPG